MNTTIRVPFEIVEHFSLRNGLSLEQSINIHEDLLSYLDEGQILKSKNHSPSLLVDEAWHSFILHTKSYSDFCMARYGCFVHHFPNSKKLDPFSKVKNILLLSHERTASCNDGTGNGQCSSDCGQHNCSDTGG